MLLNLLELAYPHGYPQHPRIHGGVVIKKDRDEDHACPLNIN